MKLSLEQFMIVGGRETLLARGEYEADGLVECPATPTAEGDFYFRDAEGKTYRLSDEAWRQVLVDAQAENR